MQVQGLLIIANVLILFQRDIQAVPQPVHLKAVQIVAKGCCRRR